MNSKHFVYMLVACAGLFVVLLATGTSLGTAVPVAIALACPVMMIVMMSGGHDSHGTGSDRSQGDRSSTHRHGS